jgi:hypothetical protein
MKHLAAIQAEFLKEARDWNKLSLEEQKDYLKRHPKSKRIITAIPHLTTKKFKNLSIEEQKQYIEELKKNMTKRLYRPVEFNVKSNADLIYSHITNLDEIQKVISKAEKHSKRPVYDKKELANINEIVKYIASNKMPREHDYLRS